MLPARPTACLVLAHGAGAGMNHPFLVAVAGGLAARGIATLRYNFPYMERGRKRPDSPPLAHATVRAAVARAAEAMPDVPLFAGGKSFGGRMTSQAQAAEPLPKVRGLVFWGFPLHPPGKPSVERAAHLAAIRVPLLFLQGTRDEFAELRLITETVRALGPLVELSLLENADHSFRVPARSGRTNVETREELLDRAAAWMRTVTEAGGS
ncbi:MAG: alpha/beta family hydrolase [Bauldia sp.]